MSSFRSVMVRYIALRYIIGREVAVKWIRSANGTDHPSSCDLSARRSTNRSRHQAEILDRNTMSDRAAADEYDREPARGAVM